MRRIPLSLDELSDEQSDFAHTHTQQNAPDTSFIAAGSVTNLRQKQRDVLRVLYELGSGSEENIQFAHRNHNPPLEPQSDSGLRARRSELVNKGLVCASGRFTLTKHNRKAIIWKPTYNREREKEMQLNFNAYDYDPSQGAAICFPLADYKIEITGAEAKPVKDNPSSGYLELALTVTEGELRGLIQKDRLNIFNTSEIAKRIAHQQLAAYCFAIGRPFVAQTEELVGGRCICTIGPQDGNDRYSDVKVVKMMDGTLPQRQGQPQAVQAAAPQAPPTAPTQQPQPTQPQPQAPPAWNQAAAPAATAAPWGNSAATAAPGSVPPWAK